MNGIKQKHILSLLQTGYTTIQVQFARDINSGSSVDADAPRGKTVAVPPWQENVQYDNLGRGHGRVPQAAQPMPPIHDLYTYKAKLTTNVKPGEAVVVEVRGRLVLALVHSVDEVPRIDTDADYDYKWIVQRVDMTEYRQCEADEQAFRDSLQQIEREKQRAATLASFMENLPQGSAERALFDSAVNRLSLNAPTPAPAPAPTAAPAQEFAGMKCQ